MAHGGHSPYFGLHDPIDVLDGESAIGHPAHQPLPVPAASPHVLAHDYQDIVEAAAHDPATESTSQTKQPEYESDCPYYGGVSLGLPKFRLVECFADNQVYIGDSYGDGSFIANNEHKPCSSHCRCRGLGSRSDDFVFTAFKTSSGLRIDFHDLGLCNEVGAVTDETTVLDSGDGAGTPTTFDGFAVLAGYHQLKHRLQSLASLDEDSSCAVLPLSLLVHGFLTNRDIFRTFGYENLYERGYLSFELWKEFQRRQLDDDITLLDDAVTAFAEADTVHCATPSPAPSGDLAVDHLHTLLTSRTILPNILWSQVPLDWFWLYSENPNTPTLLHPMEGVRKYSGSQKKSFMRRQRIGMCRGAFVREFQQIRNSLSSHDDDMTWIEVLFTHPLKAWQSGIKTLHKIAGGQLPRDLGEVIAFLCICKSASELLDLLTVSEHTRRFFADLRRWGILFDSSGFERYKAAVKRIWNYDLAEAIEPLWDASDASDVSLLMYAQGLVSSLVGTTSVLICPGVGGHPNGLAHSQQRWRDRHAAPPPPPNGDTAPTEPKPPDIPPEVETPLQRELSNEQASTPIEGKLVIVLTGAIFAILLIFLCWLRNVALDNHAATVLASPSLICSKTLGGKAAFLGCCEVLRMYLGLRENAGKSNPDWTLSTSPQNDVEGGQQAVGVDSEPPTSSLISQQSGDQEMSESPGDVNSGPGRTSVFVFSTRPAAVSAAGDGAPAKFLCNNCGRSFSTNTNRLRHMRKEQGKRYPCPTCPKTFDRNDYMRRHKCRNR